MEETKSARKDPARDGGAPSFPPPPGREREVTPPMLVNEIARLFGARMRRDELPGVMSQDSARLIMRTLAYRDGCSQLDLVRETRLKPPTVSVTVKKMEDEGLVLRRTDGEDSRVVRVFLTGAGWEHHRSVLCRLRQADAELTRGFTPEETEQLLRLLTRMRDNILPPERQKNT